MNRLIIIFNRYHENSWKVIIMVMENIFYWIKVSISIAALYHWFDKLNWRGGFLYVFLIVGKRTTRTLTRGSWMCSSSEWNEVDVFLTYVIWGGMCSLLFKLPRVRSHMSMTRQWGVWSHMCMTQEWIVRSHISMARYWGVRSHICMTREWMDKSHICMTRD